MKAKKIVFTSSAPDYEILPPIPASRFIPEWYRKMDGVKSGTETLKKCVPFLDSLTSGYMLSLSTDMIWDKNSKTFISQSIVQFNSDHIFSQTEDVSIPPEYNKQPHKWINYWHIKTPPGYSTLFIHPFNRKDLPFYTIGGIVDTDRHSLPINFPFFLREDFSGTIPKGTPMIQAIPFKRENWESSLGSVKDIDSLISQIEKDSTKMSNPPFGNYKKRWWTKKTYV